MKIGSDVVGTALIRLLRSRELRLGARLELATLQRDWAGTGLRASDLQPGLRDLELAGVLVLAEDYLQVTDVGAELLYPVFPTGQPLRNWLDDIILYRVRRRGRNSENEQRRRASDQQSLAQSSPAS